MSYVIKPNKMQEIMQEIEKYDRTETMDKILEILWGENPKLALWFAVEFELPY